MKGYWYSGNMLSSGDGDPGSIPGWPPFFPLWLPDISLFYKNHKYLTWYPNKKTLPNSTPPNPKSTLYNPRFPQKLIENPSDHKHFQKYAPKITVSCPSPPLLNFFKSTLLYSHENTINIQNPFKPLFTY